MSCGLDDIVNVKAPTVTYSNPLYSSDDYLTWYCAFATKEDEQPESFIGTEIYYKIYNNYSTLNSHRSSIVNLNTSSNGTAAASKMIETYKYQSLGTNPVESTTLFLPDRNQNTKVIFRLKNYTGADKNEDFGNNREQFLSCVKLGGVYQTYIPYRSGNSKSFDFFNDANNNLEDSNGINVEPVEGDSDYECSSTNSDSDEYYVQLFAVGVAFDESTLSNTYSLVLDLGSIPIIKGK